MGRSGGWHRGLPVAVLRPPLLLLLASGAGGLYDPVNHLEAARLYGNIDKYAYFYVDMLVGTPPQRVSVIVDTGSGVCAFPCASCGHCGQHIDPAFDFAKSSSASWLDCGTGCPGRCSSGHCSYTQGYTEGSSISGFWFQDDVAVGDLLQGNPAVRASMGCHQNENNLFYTQKANGILGMGPAHVGRRTLLQDLFQDHAHIQGNVFSLCFADWGGRLVVGGANSSYHTSSVQYVPMNVGSGYYSVSLQKMAVGEEVTLGPWGSTIVDSGTTYTYMATRNYEALRRGIESHCRVHNCGTLHQGHCWAVRNNDLSLFPDIEVVLSSTSTRWVPQAYLFLRGADGKYCYAFADDGEHASTVLGASWMLHKDIIFDMSATRLGIAQANCPEYKVRPPGPEATTTASPTSAPTTSTTTSTTTTTTSSSSTTTTTTTATAAWPTQEPTSAPRPPLAEVPAPTEKPASTPGPTVAPRAPETPVPTPRPFMPASPAGYQQTTLQPVAGVSTTTVSAAASSQDGGATGPPGQSQAGGNNEEQWRSASFNDSMSELDGGSGFAATLGSNPANLVIGAVVAGTCLLGLAVCLVRRFMRRSDGLHRHEKLKEIDESGMPPQIVGTSAEADLDGETFVIGGDGDDDEDAWEVDGFEYVPDVDEAYRDGGGGWGLASQDDSPRR